MFEGDPSEQDDQEVLAERIVDVGGPTFDLDEVVVLPLTAGSADGGQVTALRITRLADPAAGRRATTTAGHGAVT